MSFQPRCYQNTAVAAVLDSYEKGKRQVLVGLPTGAGKTVISALIIDELLKRLDGRRILFLAHRKEIIDQTAEKISRQIGSELVTVEQADRRGNPSCPVVVASVQSIMGRLDDYHPESFGALIVDECHHAYAKSWMDTIAHFGARKETLLLGLTATTKRSDGRCVTQLFQEVAFEVSLGQLQELGYLVPLEYYTVEAALGLNKLTLDGGGDFPVSLLGRIMNTPEIRSLTLRAWRERSFSRKTIVFCASVAHAEELAEDFNEKGIPADCITGFTKNRDQIIDAFRRGEIQVLTNFGVLTEGFDEPSIESVLLCRPTTSPLVYAQCLGRGLRTNPGKKQCIVIDIIDRQNHGLQYNAFQAAGLKRTWKGSGKDPMREAEAIARIRVKDPAAFLKIKNAVSLEETQKILMDLDPSLVFAGIDGMPVLRYRESTEPLPSDKALSTAAGLLAEIGLTDYHLSLKDGDFEVVFPESTRNRVSSYISWHIWKATGRTLFINYRPSEVEAFEEIPCIEKPEPIYEAVLCDFTESDDAFQLEREIMVHQTASGESPFSSSRQQPRRSGATVSRKPPLRRRNPDVSDALPISSRHGAGQGDSIQDMMQALKKDLMDL